MFKFRSKKTEETKPTEVFTLPEVVQHYVSKNDDVLDDDFTGIEIQIEKNKKVIEFLKEEKEEGFANESMIYTTERDKFEKTNKKLELQKSLIVRQIEANKKGYQKIDLSFLSMKKPSKGRLPYHPSFSTHKYNDKNKDFTCCRIDVGRYEIGIKDKNYISSYMVLKNLLKVFVTNVEEKNFRTSYHDDTLTYRPGYELPVKTDVRIETYFKGIIPRTTKQKIAEAKDLFTGCADCGIFLIKECPSWNEREITKDPLIVGVIGEKAYLIDHFDTSDLEEYIKKEFTE